MTESIVQIEDLTVAYHDKPVIWDLDMQVPKGTLFAIVGPNGAGKSTLMKALLGLVPKAVGSISVFGKNYHDVRKYVAYVPQRSSVDWDFPATVFDVVMMGRYGHLGWLKRPKEEDKKQVQLALKKLGIEQLATRHISELSGGQQQRVFLARALVQQAELYIMDEPFVGIDATTEKAILALLQELKKQGKTVIVIHHDIQTVKVYFDWVLLMNVRRIALGPVNKVMTKENLTKTYGGRAAFLAEA